MKGFMSILEKDCRKRWMSRSWKRRGTGSAEGAVTAGCRGEE